MDYERRSILFIHINKYRCPQQVLLIVHDGDLLELGQQQNHYSWSDYVLESVQKQYMILQ